MQSVAGDGREDFVQNSLRGYMSQYPGYNVLVNTFLLSPEVDSPLTFDTAMFLLILQLYLEHWRRDTVSSIVMD